MKWSEISIQTTNEAIEPISNILHEAGVSGVVIIDPADLTLEREQKFGEIYDLNPDNYPDEGVVVKAYLQASNNSVEESVDGIKQAIIHLSQYDIDIGMNKIMISEVKEEDWETSWKQYYHPVKISEKFTIVPSWEEYTPKNCKEKIIELDPGMAFGTGTHPTTVLCIQSLESIVRENDIVIDVGTGSGVLSIASALLGAQKVYALDLDEVAVQAALENINLNNCQHIINVSKNNLLDGNFERADVIVANILAEVIISFTDDVANALKLGGYFIASGIILKKKEEVKEAIRKSGLHIEKEVIIEDWVAIIAKRR